MTSALDSYAGKRVIVTGAASGIGAATAELLHWAGAQVHGLDVRLAEGPMTEAIVCDLADPAAVEATVAAIGGPVHGLFNIAGVPSTVPRLTIMAVNFFGLRHLSETVIPLMPPGSAIASVASIAGNEWLAHRDLLLELMALPDFEAGMRWAEEHDDLLGEDPYFLSKEAVVFYTMWRSRRLQDQRIRINCVSPGPVNSGMLPDFRESLGEQVMSGLTRLAGRVSEPVELAGPLAFLNSDGASFVNGANLPVDGGYTAAILSRPPR